MTILCDSSVFVAGLWEEHSHHQPSVELLQKVSGGRIKAAAATHSLAECYSVLTAMMSAYPPKDILETLKKNVIGQVAVVPLSVSDYWAVLEQLSERGLKGGIVYDALIFRAALKSKADRVVTWNEKHFTKLSRGEIPIVTPEDLK
jgi:predicted nucleic acid-binding protein